MTAVNELSGGAEVEQVHDGEPERLGQLHQVQVRGISPAKFQAAEVGTVKAALTRQILLGPALSRP